MSWGWSAEVFHISFSCAISRVRASQKLLTIGQFCDPFAGWAFQVIPVNQNSYEIFTFGRFLLNNWDGQFSSNMPESLSGQATHIKFILSRIVKMRLSRRYKYLSKINYTYLTPLLPVAFCLLPIFTRKLILHDYLSLFWDFRKSLTESRFWNPVRLRRGSSLVKVAKL